MSRESKYLISKSEIDNLEGLHKQHFLNPNARRINKSLGDLTGLNAIGFHIIEIEPGYESTELHYHYFEEECVYILHGVADAVIGDQVYRVEAGDFLGYRAGGDPHKLINTGTENLKCIVVGQRLDHDVADYPNSGKRLFRDKGLPWNLVDMKAISHPDAGRKVK